jgi:hypothetical protein
MDQTGLINNIFRSVEFIADGRRGFATLGREQDGRVFYEKGIAQALAGFKVVATISDSKIIALAEQTFLQQELAFCTRSDTNAQNSLLQALGSFDDAFLCLEAVEEAGYITADKTHPHGRKYRIQDYPKDAFHIACIAHHTRLYNIIRSPGIDMIEKALLVQRAANMKIAQRRYIEKQKVALGG